MRGDMDLERLKRQLPRHCGGFSHRLGWEVNEVWEENGPDVPPNPALAGAATDPGGLTNVKSPAQAELRRGHSVSPDPTG